MTNLTVKFGTMVNGNFEEARELKVSESELQLVLKSQGYIETMRGFYQAKCEITKTTKVIRVA